jgi:hypothetical protein
MKGANLCASLVLLALWTTGCHKAASPPQQAQAPPLQTGKGTLPPPDTTQQQEKSETPLASPLPPPSAQSVPLPPPTPKKVHGKKPKPAPSKSTDTTQSAAATGGSTPAASGATAQAASPRTVSTPGGSGSPIGQLTTGDSALGERTKHETADLIGGTQQGLNGIKRSLSTEEQVTASQIRTFLKQAQQELDSGDTDGAHTLATKAKLLLDELTKP